MMRQDRRREIRGSYDALRACASPARRLSASLVCGRPVAAELSNPTEGQVSDSASTERGAEAAFHRIPRLAKMWLLRELEAHES